MAGERDCLSYFHDVGGWRYNIIAFIPRRLISEHASSTQNMDCLCQMSRASETSFEVSRGRRCCQSVCLLQNSPGFVNRYTNQQYKGKQHSRKTCRSIYRKRTESSTSCSKQGDKGVSYDAIGVSDQRKQSQSIHVIRLAKFPTWFLT